MPIELTVQLIVFLVGVGVYTLAAAYTDFRSRRIPNPLTVTAFALGLVYQLVFNGLPGLGDAMLGFLVGFGLLFVLWMVGGGGGGDVKLMGGLSVWLGFKLTLYVLAASTVAVILITGGVLAWSVLAKGGRRTKEKFLATGKSEGKSKRNKKKPESVEERQKRRVMAYAIPVAVATWVVVAWKLPEIANAGEVPPPKPAAEQSGEAEPGTEEPAQP